MTALVAVAPAGRSEMNAAIADGLEGLDAKVVDVADAEALLWADPRAAAELPDAISHAPHLRWIHLPWAGIEAFRPHLDPAYAWTCGKDVFSRPVAEHALGLTLAGLRNIAGYARAGTWGEQVGRNLLGARVTILGGGGICRAFLALLEPFGCDVTVVRRQTDRVPGAARTVTADALPSIWPTTDVVLVALALTPATHRIIGAAALAALPGHAWVINVGRGGHIDTDALVVALEARSIGGAALDVTDPEPLPDHHPLWGFDNCIITPHVANTPEMGLPLIVERARRNVDRFSRGEPLIGLVDLAEGY